MEEFTRQVAKSATLLQSVATNSDRELPNGTEKAEPQSASGACYLRSPLRLVCTFELIKTRDRAKGFRMYNNSETATPSFVERLFSLLPSISFRARFRAVRKLAVRL